MGASDGYHRQLIPSRPKMRALDIYSYQVSTCISFIYFYSTTSINIFYERKKMRHGIYISDPKDRSLTTVTRSFSGFHESVKPKLTIHTKSRSTLNSKTEMNINICPSSCNISNLSAHVSPHISASFPLFYIVFPPVEVAPINNIQKKRKAYREAKVFLKWICDKNRHSDDNENQNPALDKFYRGSLMEAVRLDVPEVLNQIMDISSKALDFKETDGYNIIQLAIINRSPKVYNLIRPIIERKEDYRSMEDHWRNNLLHLAGRLAPLTVLSCTTGAALQLQRELQWRKQVEKLMEPAHLTAENLDCETPEKVFSREHENLVKDGERWIKTTAESCSITAALIITIVFAAAITVPGGSNQETGIPLFKKKIAFNIFALADAVSLFSASTSLLVFLSILTTRFAEKDFLISLPRRLFVGLCLLFLSTTAMMLAFSTILFLVFCDERPWMLAPIGGLTCLPIAAIVTLQLPLVIDLYQAIYIPIFGKDEKEEKVQTLFEAEDKKEKGKLRNILRDINPILRRRAACCLPVHRGNL
ncbi:PGG domain-containing protein [Artemisia annua]|uniref:PGG domain-containing protein n=1 Tax=Artemisia annua TaxID=35608 RepID=A0A2U1KPK2_ARTAN|nr:PGG domain-containing protein [Artemisia annua]